MFKNKFSIILLAVALLLLVGCGGNDADTDERADDTSENTGTEEVAEDLGLLGEIQKEGEITVATSGTLIAASFYNDDDELTGYDVEVAREIANRLGVDVDFEIMGIDSMLEELTCGLANFPMISLEITPAVHDQFIFPFPNNHSHPVSSA